MKTILAMALAAVFMAPAAAVAESGGPTPGTSRSPVWIVAYSGINQMNQVPGGPAVVTALTSDPRTIIVAANPLRNGFDNRQRAVSALSLDACRTALAKPANAGLKTLFVDLEKWGGTPVADQRNPEAVTRTCHDLAHRSGRDVTVIATPGMDLMSVIRPGYPGTQYQAAIHDDLEGKLAVVSDAVEVQVENIEDRPDHYEGTVRTIVGQIRRARARAHLNPDIPIYAGLSTGVVGRKIPTGTLIRDLKEDVRRTRGLVTGYWMAIPPRSLCPGCGAPNPAVAVGLLQSLGG